MTTPPPEPPRDALFARAAYWLDDFMDLLRMTDSASEDMEEEIPEISRRLKELAGEWEAKQEAGTVRSAAEIVAAMLKDWKLPGAVWYFPPSQRWRVTGDGYEPEDGEVCVGVYGPGVSADELEYDFHEVAK